MNSIVMKTALESRVEDGGTDTSALKGHMSFVRGPVGTCGFILIHQQKTDDDLQDSAIVVGTPRFAEIHHRKRKFCDELIAFLS